jgi:hypothetical protein
VPSRQAARPPTRRMFACPVAIRAYRAELVTHLWEGPRHGSVGRLVELWTPHRGGSEPSVYICAHTSAKSIHCHSKFRSFSARRAMSLLHLVTQCVTRVGKLTVWGRPPRPYAPVLPSRWHVCQRCAPSVHARQRADRRRGPRSRRREEFEGAVALSWYRSPTVLRLASLEVAILRHGGRSPVRRAHAGRV